MTNHNTSGEYIINPTGTSETPVYCHINYKDKTFYRDIQDGGFESNINNSNYKTYLGNLSTEEVYLGNNSMKFTDQSKTKIFDNFTLVDPNKKYKLSGWFKTGNSSPRESKLYFGFAEYDKDFKIIYSFNVNITVGTETYLTKDVDKDDTSVEFADIDTNGDGIGDMCDKWKNSLYIGSSNVYSNFIAFDIDDSGSYNDLPNFNISGYFKRGSNITDTLIDNGDTCTVFFATGYKANFSYKAGTKIRRHSGGNSYNYVAASGISPIDYISKTWTEKSGIVEGYSNFGINSTKFRKGTKFIKPLLIVNYWYTSGETGQSDYIFVDDLKMEETH